LKSKAVVHHMASSVQLSSLNLTSDSGMWIHKQNCEAANYEDTPAAVEYYVWKNARRGKDITCLFPNAVED
jgi:hypothetical protein